MNLSEFKNTVIGTLLFTGILGGSLSITAGVVLGIDHYSKKLEEKRFRESSDISAIVIREQHKPESQYISTGKGGTIAMVDAYYLTLKLYDGVGRDTTFKYINYDGKRIDSLYNVGDKITFRKGFKPGDIK